MHAHVSDKPAEPCLLLDFDTPILILLKSEWLQAFFAILEKPRIIVQARGIAGDLVTTVVGSQRLSRYVDHRVAEFLRIFG